MKARIYEIKSSAAANAEVLRDEENDRFYWNDLKFQGFDIGDQIFFVNTHGGWAMYTTIGEKDIATTRTPEGQARFTYDGRDYSVDDPSDRFKNFIRFDVVQESPIEAGDEWTSLGSSEVNDLWLGDREVEASANRMQRIEQLKRIFRDGEGAKALEGIEGLLGKRSALNPIIENALKADWVKQLLEEDEFHLKLGQDKLKEFESLPGDPSFFRSLDANFKAKSQIGLIKVVSDYPEGSAERRAMQVLAELITYCDGKAAGKNDLNAYPDHRTVANPMVRMAHWINNLIEYRAASNDLDAISALSVRNAIAYLKDPVNEVPITNDEHRRYIAAHLMNRTYNADSFVKEMKQFFAPYGLNPKNPENLTTILGKVVYKDPEVHQLWYGIGGLICVASGKWFEDAIKDFNAAGKIVMWWSEVPTYGQQTIQQLKDAIRLHGYFNLYYTKEQRAHHRARVIDFAFKDEYAAKNWNKDGNVAWHETSFDAYKGESARGTMQQAKVAFLVDAFEPLDPEIPADEFRFVRTVKGLTQSNLLPYISLDGEPEWDAHTPGKEHMPMMATRSEMSFKDDHRAILCAIKTKPFILLAGISGTGKSRLVRTLAYQTCSVPELRGDRPGNFALIMVKPNWHDPTEMLGYVSRIDGQPRYVVTEFLRFLVKAWQYPDVPFFLCLDEMNLAPVEHYFADYLSVVETRREKDGKVISDAILSTANMDDPKVFENALDKLGLDGSPELKAQFLRDGITLPHNLVVMGTVNMDETTHSFSRKVLDRAMTFEMNHVDLKGGLEPEDKDWGYPETSLSPVLLLGDITRGGAVPVEFAERDEVLKWLEKLNDVLKGTPFKVAYRVRDEFLIYTYHNSLLTNKEPHWLDMCLDELLVMKVLSRIEGDEGRVHNVLENLKALLPDTWVKSNEKLLEMQGKLAFGYTSYWS